MNRRSFFSKLLVAAAAPSILIPRLADHHRFRATEAMIPNPMWVDPRNYYGRWCFVQYTQQENGIWAAEIKLKPVLPTDRLIWNSFTTMEEVQQGPEGYVKKITCCVDINPNWV